MTKVIGASIWIETDLKVDRDYDDRAVEALTFEHSIHETESYGSNLLVRVELVDGTSFEAMVATVEEWFRPLVEAQAMKMKSGNNALAR